MRLKIRVTARTMACAGSLVVSAVLAVSCISGGTASGSLRRRVVVHSSGASAAGTFHLTGAGSTFDAPFFFAAFSAYHELHPNVSISYAAVGSGMGIARFSAESTGTWTIVPPSAIDCSAAVMGTSEAPKFTVCDYREDLPRQDHELGRPGDCRPEPNGRTPEHPHHCHSPFR